MPSDIIVVRGAPGSGKSSVARHLGRQLPTGATIEVDTIRGMIHHIQWECDELHIDAIHAAVSGAIAYLERGYRPVVLVDTFGFGRLELALAALGPRTVSVHSLTCHNLVLSLRLWTRLVGYRNASAARRFNAHIAADQAKHAGVLDTTWRHSAAIARRILVQDGWIS